MAIFFTLLALGLVSAIVLVRYRQKQDDEARRAQQRSDYEAREIERERNRFFTQIERFFPWVGEPLKERLEAGEEPEGAFWLVLAEAPAIELGTTMYGLPALLPLAERSKHLYIVGKTGSGKTSLLVNLIREDLEAGRGLAVIAPDEELFRDWLLPLLPPERADALIYFAPGLDDNPITFNPIAVEPGDDPRRAASEIATILTRVLLGDEELGSRVAPILGNVLACLVGRRRATLSDVRRFLLDQAFRERLVDDVSDPYAKEFWCSTYTSFPKGAHLPILNRLDQLFRPKALRRALCHPVSSFSIRRVLEREGVLFLNLSHLEPESVALLGRLMLAHFQLQLIRRGALPEEERQPFHLYADEFQSLSETSDGTWRELLSRGRRYGLSLTLAHQHPSQLATNLHEEILGNVASIVSFALSAQDAYALRREFTQEDVSDLVAHPLEPEELISLRVGQAVARLGSGAFAIPLTTAEPKERPNQALGLATRSRSWERYGIPLSAREEQPTGPDASSLSRKTRTAPPICSGDGILLGTNSHAGKTIHVTLTERQRSQHLYVIGSSGTGKSTFLLNLISQGMEKGEGLAVLDPHGDLIDHVLSLVPKSREEDVVIVDPSDRDFPVGFNVLQAHSDLEKELLASDLVDVFRRLSVRWGDQMNSVLANAILAFLESDRGGTLLDLRRFLVEPEYRETFLPSVRDPEVAYYWRKEFPMLSGKPQAPLLSRLDAFLRPKLIRNMVSQSRSRLDFARIMDSGQIFLGRLSQGAIGEGNAYLLGSLLVSKFYQLAIARQAVEERARRPFYLYIDECHNFLTPSMASILAGARKYHLGLILAHQELQQVAGKDSDVLSAVITNPYTRICFRLGDLDAVKLAKGFAHFDAEDLQSLGVGEAICRVERAGFDFNLRTSPMPEVASAVVRSRPERLIALSRERYGTSRAAIEAERAIPEPSEPAAIPLDVEEPRAVPRVAPTPEPIVPSRAVPAPVLTPTTAVVPTPGRGGQRHKYLQSLIKRWGESHGYRATIEKQILNGAGSVDVALEGQNQSIAVEISVTSSPNQELTHIRSCLEGGFNHVVALSENPRNVEQLSALLERELNQAERTRVSCLAAESLFTFLGKLASESAASESTIRGYRVSVEYQPTGEALARQKKRAISDVVADALRRMKD